MRKKETNKLPIPDDWDGQSWRLAVLCVPDSTLWRAHVRGTIYELARGRTWNRDTGTITDAQAIGYQILESLDMTCGEDITRIADAAEAISQTLTDWYDTEYIDLDDLKQALEAAGLQKWANWIDLMGETNELLSFLTPAFGLKLPKMGFIESIGTFLFRQRILSRMDQHLVNQQASTVATQGPTIQTLLQELQQLLPADELVDTFLGNTDEVIGATGADLVTLLTGNYLTNKLDDVRNALDGGFPLPGTTGNYVTNKLDDLNNTINSKPTLTPTNSACCGVIEGGQTVQDPEPDLGDPQTDPPPSDFPDWPTYDDYKCRASNRLADDLVTSFTNLANISGALAGVAVVALVGVLATLFTGGMFAPIVAVGLVAGTALTAAILVMVGLITSGGLSTFKYFSNLATEIDNAKGTLVCDLYGSQNVQEAKNIVLAAINDAAQAVQFDAEDQPLNSLWIDAVDDFATEVVNDNMINTLFTEHPDAASYVGTVDCTACAGCSQYTLEFGVLISGDPMGAPGEQFTLEAVPRGGAFTYHLVVIEYDCNRTIEIVSYTNWVGGDPDSADDISLLDGTEIYSGGVNDPPPTGQDFCAARFSIAGDGNLPRMQVVFEIKDDGCTPA